MTPEAILTGESVPGGCHRFWFTPDQRLGFHYFSHAGPTRYPARLHDEYAFVFCRHGSFHTNEEDRRETVVAGELVVENPLQWRSSAYGCEGLCDGLALIVKRQTCVQVCTETGWRPSEGAALPVFEGKCPADRVARLAVDVLDELADARMGQSFLLEALAKEFLLRSLRCRTMVDAAVVDTQLPLLPRRHFVLAISYMHRHGKAAFGVDSMCRSLGTNVADFCRLFRNSTGLTPLRVYNQLLIERAQAELRKRSTSIKEIAYSLGFRSPSHMTTLYRQMTGRVPSEDAVAC